MHGTCTDVTSSRNVRKVRVFRREEVLKEITETDRVTHLDHIQGGGNEGMAGEGQGSTRWSYGLANGKKIKLKHSLQYIFAGADVVAGFEETSLVVVLMLIPFVGRRETVMSISSYPTPRWRCCVTPRSVLIANEFSPSMDCVAGNEDSLAGRKNT